MSNQENPCPNWRERLTHLWPCLLVALAVRIYFFSGVSLADDVNYWTQSIATGLHGDWPPLKYHWHVRLGLILPCALLLKIFGLKLWAPYLFTIIAGLLEIVLTYHIALRLTNPRTAWLAAWFCVFYPLNILYSTYLYVDLWAGVLGAASLYFWHRGLEKDRIRYYILASTFFGLAWLFRETILMCAPVFAALYFYSRRWQSHKFLWIFPPALLIAGGECLVFKLATGNWLYRMDAVQAARGQLAADFSSVKSFYLMPFVELVTSHELGVFMISAILLACWKFSKTPRALSLWLLVGFGWFCWGTTIPFAWLPLQGDPRYLAVLTCPCLIIVAYHLNNVQRPTLRKILVASFITSGLLGAGMDLATVKRSAYEKFADSKYNTADTALEPFVYFGTRAATGFVTNGMNFNCATDLGRATAMKQISYIPGTRLMPSEAARFIVLSPQTHYEKTKRKTSEGWRTVAIIYANENKLRHLAVQLLTLVGQPGHREPIVQTPVLLVLENPARAVNEPPAQPSSPAP